EQRDMGPAAARLFGGEEASFQRSDAENLKEITNDLDARRGHGFAVAGEAHIVGSGKGLVTGDALIGKTLIPKLLVRVGGIRRAGEAARCGWRSNPYELV